MTVYSNTGFSGGSKASPDIANFPFGATSRAGNGMLTTSVGLTLSADSAEDILFSSPGSAITQNLPKTNVKAGRRFRFFVTGATEANYVAIRSNNGTEIDRIGGSGVIEVVANKDNPELLADWTVVDVEETTNEITGTPTGAVINQISAYFHRRKNIVTVRVSQTAGTASATNNISLGAGFVPSRFRNSQQSHAVPSVHDNGTQKAGRAQLENSGALVFFKFDNSNYSGSSGVSSSPSVYISFSYFKY